MAKDESSKSDKVEEAAKHIDEARSELEEATDALEKLHEAARYGRPDRPDEGATEYGSLAGDIDMEP